MRIKVNFSPSVSFLVRDYRRYFISFLKTIFTSQGIYDDLYDEKKAKPFSFSIWFGEDFRTDDEKITLGENLSLVFSSGDPRILAAFYNGTLDLKKKEEEISLGEGKLVVQDISLLPHCKIFSNQVLFKTIGISVLTDPSASAKDFKQWYLLPTEDLAWFNKVLKERIKGRYKYLKNEDKEFNLEFKNLTDSEFQILKAGCLIGLKFDKPIKETLVEHYDGYVRGFRGVFWLSGESEILQFIYDYGFGVRTGQGFGLLDIITQC
ncbi:MAG: CRISPR-associated endoribonuclease Cas6 [candidate division WOR-3 bacterium]